MDKKRVLIVDDEEDIIQALKLILGLKGAYEVSGLTNAKDILAKVHLFRPDIILLDLVMPEIGGLEACEMLNNDPLGKSIPIIIVSALDKDVDKCKAFKLGAVDYLVKPIQVEILVAAIEKALKFRK